MRAVVGTYWPKRKDAAEQALGMAALSLDEAGRAWLFVRHDGDLVGFVLSGSEGPNEMRFEPAPGVEPPTGLAGAWFRVVGDELFEERAGAVATRRKRDSAKELALLAPGTKLQVQTMGGEARAFGPLLVWESVGSGASGCVVGIVVPQPPAMRAGEKARPGRVVATWMGDSLVPAEGEPCGLAARASKRPVEVAGRIFDVVLVGDRSGPLALVAVGYMAAIPFVVSERASDPGLEQAIHDALRSGL
jgi:hypothetical protein